MKTKFLSLFFMLGLVTIYSQSPDDISSIKAMCGCHKVNFNFAETFSYPLDPTGYRPSPTKQDEEGVEWIQLVEETPGKLVLQHLLIVSDKMIIKHWRQDWLYEDLVFYTYTGENNWKYKALSKGEVHGKWTQKVYQVDDGPRYQGIGTWIHSDGRHYWESTANAPLPRREYTQRSDYDILKRKNLHEITPDGWIHDQDNDKIKLGPDGAEQLIAREKGINIYTKLDDRQCKAALQWWTDHHVIWDKVRQQWEMQLAQAKDLRLVSTLDGKTLSDRLQNLDNQTPINEIEKVITQYIKTR